MVQMVAVSQRNSRLLGFDLGPHLGIGEQSTRAARTGTRRGSATSGSVGSTTKGRRRRRCAAGRPFTCPAATCTC
jgi:hypothetical protein